MSANANREGDTFDMTDANRLMRKRNCKPSNFYGAEIYPSIKPHKSYCDPSLVGDWLSDPKNQAVCPRLFNMQKDDVLEVWNQSPDKHTLSFYGVSSHGSSPEAALYNNALMKSLQQAQVTTLPKIRPRKKKISDVLGASKNVVTFGNYCKPFVLNRKALKAEIVKIPSFRKKLAPREDLSPVKCRKPVNTEKVSSTEKKLSMKKQKSGLRRKHWYCSPDCGIPKNPCTDLEWSKYLNDPRPYDKAFEQLQKDQKEVEEKVEDPKDYDELYTRFIGCFDQNSECDELYKLYEQCCKQPTDETGFRTRPSELERPERSPSKGSDSREPRQYESETHQNESEGHKNEPETRKAVGEAPKYENKTPKQAKDSAHKPGGKSEEKSDKPSDKTVDLEAKPEENTLTETAKAPEKSKESEEKPVDTVDKSDKKANQPGKKTEEKPNKPENKAEEKPLSEEKVKKDIQMKPQKQERKPDETAGKVEEKESAKPPERSSQKQEKVRKSRGSQKPEKNPDKLDGVQRLSNKTKEKETDKTKTDSLNEFTSKRPVLPKEADTPVGESHSSPEWANYPVDAFEEEADQKPPERPIIPPTRKQSKEKKSTGKPDVKDSEGSKEVPQTKPDNTEKPLFDERKNIKEIVTPASSLTSLKFGTPRLNADLLQDFEIKKSEHEFFIKLGKTERFPRVPKKKAKVVPKPTEPETPKDCPCPICKFMKRRCREPDTPLIREMKKRDKERQIREYLRRVRHREYMKRRQVHNSATQHKCDPIICDNFFCRNPKLFQYCDCLKAMQKLKAIIERFPKMEESRLNFIMEDLQRRICKRICECMENACEEQVESV